MSEKITLKVSSSTSCDIYKEINSITIPSIGGEMTILPSHIPIITGLKNGYIEIKATDSAQKIKVSSGSSLRFIDNQCTVALAEIHMDKLVKNA